MSLFEEKGEPKLLSERLRPKTLNEFVGHPELTSSEGILRKIIEKDMRVPLILWGPSGVGKTSVGYVIANEKKLPLLEFTTAIHTPRDVIKEIKRYASIGKVPVVLLNEIHRYNKLQQEQLLPYLEKGDCIFVFTTTENPSFSLKSSFLSRSRVVEMKPLSENDIVEILKKAFEKDEGANKHRTRFKEETLKAVAELSCGDARFALNLLQNLIEETKEENITPEIVKDFCERKTIGYQRSGDDRYLLISAFIKSMRGSDPDASLYYLARMLEGGEDPLYIARRMIIFASEDVGLADPNALVVAVSAYHAFEKVGLPEGWIPLAEAAVYLSCAPKSNSAYIAYLRAKEDVKKDPHAPVPLKLRNPSTKFLEELGYGQNYTYPHNLPEGWSPEHYLPEKLKGRIYYTPTDRGFEKEIKRVVERLRKLRDENSGS